MELKAKMILLIGKKTHRKINSGFTLVEILLVVILLAVVAGLAIPNLGRSLTGTMLNDSTQQIAYLMRYAQMKAMSQNKIYQLVFSDDRTQFWLVHEAEKKEGASDKDKFIRLDGRWGRTWTVPEELKVVAPQEKINFAADGTIEKLRISVCLKEKDQCLYVSTQEQQGYVDILEALPAPPSEETES
jgi:type II secretion system protein H